MTPYRTLPYQYHGLCIVRMDIETRKPDAARQPVAIFTARASTSKRRTSRQSNQEPSRFARAPAMIDRTCKHTRNSTTSPCKRLNGVSRKERRGLSSGHLVRRVDRVDWFGRKRRGGVAFRCKESQTRWWRGVCRVSRGRISPDVWH
jgi:hypothetical protein